MFTYRFTISVRNGQEKIDIQADSLPLAVVELFGRGIDIRTILNYVAVVDGEEMGIGFVAF